MRVTILDCILFPLWVCFWALLPLGVLSLSWGVGGVFCDWMASDGIPEGPPPAILRLLLGFGISTDDPELEKMLGSIGNYWIARSVTTYESEGYTLTVETSHGRVQSYDINLRRDAYR